MTGERPALSSTDEELVEFVRDLVPQLNTLADRLERFVERTKDLPLPPSSSSPHSVGD